MHDCSRRLTSLYICPHKNYSAAPPLNPPFYRRRRKNFPSFDGSVQSGWQNYRQDYDFNIFSGEGHGRVEEFKQLGKRIVNPRHTSEIFSEHSRDELNRQRNSINRYEKPMPLSLNRERQLASEGFLNSKKETMIIGWVVFYGKGGC